MRSDSWGGREGGGSFGNERLLSSEWSRDRSLSDLLSVCLPVCVRSRDENMRISPLQLLFVYPLSLLVTPPSAVLSTAELGSVTGSERDLIGRDST